MQHKRGVEVVRKDVGGLMCLMVSAWLICDMFFIFCSANGSLTLTPSTVPVKLTVFPSRVGALTQRLMEWKTLYTVCKENLNT